MINDSTSSRFYFSGTTFTTISIMSKNTVTWSRMIQRFFCDHCDLIFLLKYTGNKDLQTDHDQNNSPKNRCFSGKSCSEPFTDRKS